MGNRSKRIELANSQKQLSIYEYSRTFTQPTRSYGVLFPRCMWSLSCSKNQASSHACTAFISLFGTFQYNMMPFGLANAGSVYSRMLDIAMKDVDREFWTS